MISSILSIIVMIITCGMLIYDLHICKKNKVLKEDLEALKEWCASTGKNPDDFINVFNTIRKEIKKSEVKK